ncbi:CDP-glycerol glycerophosphotransferase family protein [Pararhizobium sp. O133]|uniref:CDP-glycerol glycerophosphotransferase family protein n=1 Tax=Pararhizobium sp. O133 TaxID=3449278 RepID=UPI003F683867
MISSAFRAKIFDVALRIAVLVPLMLVMMFIPYVNTPTILVISLLFYIFVLDLVGFIIVKYVRKFVNKVALRLVGGASGKSRKRSGAGSTGLSSWPSEGELLSHMMSHCEFVLYFDSPKGTAYQVLMWLPFLRMLNRPFQILCRQPGTAAELRAAGVPVFYLKSITELDAVIGSAPVKAVFYVNNAMRNMHVVRYNNFVHIQLLHGESDKPSSYNPVSKMYDFLFVSGQLAIDRYQRNDVFIDHQKFRIVSRPQVFEIDADFQRGNEIKTVFYALTWGGLYANQDLSSIENAEAVVQALIDRNYRVIMRPHPLSYEHAAHKTIIARVADMLTAANEASQAGHCISNDRRFDMQYPSANDCINAADFMIADVTSIIGDWLYSKKPFAVIDPHSDKEEFDKNNPLAGGAYYIDRELTTLDAVLTDVATVDSLYETRLQSRQYALGVGENESPVDRFLTEARDVLENFDKIEHERQLANRRSERAA